MLILASFLLNLAVGHASDPVATLDDDFELPEFTANSFLYRGTHEGYAPLTQIIRMISRTHGPDDIIPSKRWQNLRAYSPRTVSDSEITLRIQNDVQTLRQKGLLWSYADCHSDWYECAQPPFDDLIGPSFQSLLLSESSSELQTKVQALEFGYSSLGGIEPALYFFDPVISTSIVQSVAQSFAKDKVAADGSILQVSYVLTLSDSQHRHCSLTTKSKEPWDCIMTATEYVDEFEYPFFGVIQADEVIAVQRGNTEIHHTSTPNRIRVEILTLPHLPVASFELEKNQPDSSCSDDADRWEEDSDPEMDPSIRSALRSEGWLCRSKSLVR